MATMNEYRLAAMFVMEVFRAVETQMRREKEDLIHFIKSNRHNLINNRIFISFESEKPGIDASFQRVYQQIDNLNKEDGYCFDDIYDKYEIGRRA